MAVLGGVAKDSPGRFDGVRSPSGRVRHLGLTGRLGVKRPDVLPMLRVFYAIVRLRVGIYRDIIFCAHD